MICTNTFKQLCQPVAVCTTQARSENVWLKCNLAPDSVSEISMRITSRPSSINSKPSSSENLVITPGYRFPSPSSNLIKPPTWPYISPVANGYHFEKMTGSVKALNTASFDW